MSRPMSGPMTGAAPRDAPRHDVHLVTASVRCADLLDGPEQPLDVLGVLPVAVYLATRARPADVVAVLTRDAVRHPAALVMAVAGDAQPFRTVDATALASIGAGRVVLPLAGPGVRSGPAALELRAGRWYDPRPQLPFPAPAQVAAASELLDRHLAAAEASSVDRAARSGAIAGLARLEEVLIGLVGGSRIADDGADDGEGDRTDEVDVADGAGRVARAVDGLLGAGPGLTPSGDDMLAGLVATLVHVAPDLLVTPPSAALRTHLRSVAHARTTLLSAALLRHATDGAVAEPFARLLRAIVDVGRVGPTIPAEALPDAVAAVRAIGASSGLDLLAGCAAALRIATASVEPGRDGHLRVLVDDTVHAHREAAR
jgi:hypothetical protein